MAFGDTAKLGSSNRTHIGNLFNDVQNGVPLYGGISTGSSNTYVLGFSSGNVPTIFVTGARYYFISDKANTGTVTISINSVTKTLRDQTGGVDIPEGAIRSGDLVEFFYDGTYCRLIGIASSGAEQLGSDSLAIGGDITLNPFQRRTSATSPATDTYVADRFMVNYSTTGTVTCSKAALGAVAPDIGLYIGSTLKVACTGTDGSIAAGDHFSIQHRIEGQNFLKLYGIPFCLVLVMKTTKAGTYCIAVQNSGNDRSFVHEVALAANTLTTVVIRIPAAPTAGTWDYTNGIGLRVCISLVAGSNFHTASPDTWVSASVRATANQVNFLDSTSNEFQLGYLGVFPGTRIATPYANWRKGIGVTRLECQRYYEQSYDDGTLAGTATSTGCAKTASGAGNNANATSTTGDTHFQVYFRATKRANPTITTYDMAGNSGKISSWTTDNLTPAGITFARPDKFELEGGNATRVNGDIRFQWKAEAEL